MPNTHATLGSLFTDIADAIRTKTGDTADIIADNFPTAIANISTGESNTGRELPRLYITLATADELSNTFNFSQTVSNGVTVNWGDGSAAETFAGVGDISATHTYPAVGNYLITTITQAGCEFGIGLNVPSQGFALGTVAAAPRIKNIWLEGVSALGKQVFTGCTGIKSVILPKGITTLPVGAFVGCWGLASIDIPDSVTTMGDQVFQQAGLISVSISKSITIIPNSAFAQCVSLKRIYMRAVTPPEVKELAFSLVYLNAIYVPVGSVYAYKAAAGWSSFASKIYPMP